MSTQIWKDAVISSAVRTPVAKARGKLAALRAEQLGAITVQAAVERAGIDPAAIDQAIMTNVNNLDLRAPGKYITLDLGYPTRIVSYNVEHGCASSLTAVALSSMLIQTGGIRAAIAGGVEHSSTAVYLMDRPTSGYSMTPPQWCTIKTTPASYENLNMGQTAERIAKHFSITREDCDKFALLSHQRAATAWETHVFDKQIIPVTVPVRKGQPVLVDKDDIFRPDCSLEQLSRLPDRRHRDRWQQLALLRR